MVRNCQEGEAVGGRDLEVESCNGRMFREWVEQQHLAAVNTFGPEESDVRKSKWDA